MAKDSQVWDADELRAFADELDYLELDICAPNIERLTLGYRDEVTDDDVDITVSRRGRDDRLGVQLVGW